MRVRKIRPILRFKRWKQLKAAHQRLKQHPGPQVDAGGWMLALADYQVERWWNDIPMPKIVEWDGTPFPANTFICLSDGRVIVGEY